MIQVIQLLLALSLLIVLHEFGHYFFARLFKTRVEKFYLFFDFLFPFSNVLPFSLFKKKKGDTEYGIGWFPLGGYVKIAGMVDESMDKEQLAKPPQPWEFRAKKPYQRLLIMLGGVIVNIILAFFIYAMILFVWGEKKLPLSEVRNGIFITDSMAYNLGFQNGDKILKIDDKTPAFFDEVMPTLLFANQVTVERNHETVTFILPHDWIGKLNNKPLFTFSPPTVIGETVEGSAAAAAGLQAQDIITGINQQSITGFAQFSDYLKNHAGETIEVDFVRDNIAKTTTATISDSGTLGFRPMVDMNFLEKNGLLTLHQKKYGFFEAFPAGVSLGMSRLADNVKQIGLILNFNNGAYKQTGGFISMAKIYGNEWDWFRFWNITAFISLALAVMNLLPIPGLDGGHVLFTLWEMITGKPVGEKFLESATTIGLVLLLALMVLVNGNDIYKLIFK